jgi:general L-amino acid transport system permease protein
MLPAVTNQYLNLTKNSSLAIVIGYSELFLVSSTIINNAGHAVPMFTLIIGTYLGLNLIISLVMNWLNRRVQLAQI